MSTTMGTTLAEKRTYTPTQVVNIAITLLLMFGVGFLPPFATLTPMGMRVLGVFLGIVWGYTTWDVVTVSLFAFAAFGFTGFSGGFDAAVSSMLGNSTVYQSLVLYFASGAIVYYGFGKWFTRWSLSRKIFQRSPIFYTWCCMMAFMVAGVFVSQMMLLLCPIWNDIADNCGYDKKKDNFRYFGCGGILLSLSLGGGLLAYRGWKLGLANQWAELVGEPINLGFQLVVNLILSIIVITVYVIFGSKVFKIDYSKMQYFDVEKMDEESKHLRPRVKRMLIPYGLAIALAIFTTVPGISDTAFFDFIGSTITVGGLYTLCAVLLMVIPSGEHDGEPCLPFKKITKAIVNWPTLMMCAVTIPVATALSSDGTGVLPWVNSIFAPLFEGRSAVIVVIFAVIVMQFLTNIGSNIAFGAAMISIVGPFAVQSGLNLTVVGTAVIFCANLGLVLPGASAPAAQYHSMPFLPDGGKRIRVTLFMVACFTICAILVYSPVAILFK